MSSNRSGRYSAFVLLVVSLFFLSAENSYAIILTGYFPTEQGCFWNFKKEDNTHYSWAINGTFTLRNVGKVIVLSQDNGSFVSVRDGWGGLYIYGEYWPDKYLIPDEPMLFVPREMQLDTPINYTAQLTLYTRPKGEHFKAQGKITRHVSLTLKSIEDVTVGDREISSGAIIEKTIHDDKEKIGETLWLAPTVGPIKRIITRGEKQTTHTLLSYVNSERTDVPVFSIRDYFPLTPGLRWEFNNEAGKPFVIETGKQEKLYNLDTTPFVENNEDIFYYAFTPEGLVLNQVYWFSVNGCSLFQPPNPPVTVFPITLKRGSYYSSISYPRIASWPSKSIYEDFNPEMQYSSIVLCTEDIVVPAGTYRNCLKIALYAIARNFNMRNEKIALGYLWLAQGVGIVKEEMFDFTNYFIPQRESETSNIRFLKLKEFKKSNEPDKSAGRQRKIQ